MPGLGYVLGGLITSAFGTRATFLVAGAGVIAIVAISAPLLGVSWRAREPEPATDGHTNVGSESEIMVELIPAGRSPQSQSETPIVQSEPEVRR
jgi:hypothetical protein